ncbi:MAG: formylglycine-generating enzyme family protein [Polyangiaceae bacterium]
MDSRATPTYPSRIIAVLLCVGLLGSCSKTTQSEPASDRHPATDNSGPGGPLAEPSLSASTASTVQAATPSAAPNAVEKGTTLTSSSVNSKPLMEALGFEISERYERKRFTWFKVERLNWQASAGNHKPLQPLTPAARDGAGCPAGMLRVKGKFLLDQKGREDTDDVQLVQNQSCKKWRTNDHGVNGLCDEFDRDDWLEKKRDLETRELDVCIDRFEFPNTFGEYPLVVTTFAEAEKYCKGVGKRLCDESEWTLACEGEEGLPYPYGYTRDKQSCNIDVLANGPDKDTFRPRTTGHTASGLDLAWQGRRSGESPQCVSPYGVYDLTGNVDEWTRSVRSYGYRMILKGGHWGPARQRCRPQTRGHGPHYVRYDQGFRCCSDPEVK